MKIIVSETCQKLCNAGQQLKVSEINKMATEEKLKCFFSYTHFYCLRRRGESVDGTSEFHIKRREKTRKIQKHKNFSNSWNVWDNGACREAASCGASCVARKEMFLRFSGCFCLATKCLNTPSRGIQSSRIPESRSRLINFLMRISKTSQTTNCSEIKFWHNFCLFICFSNFLFDI